VPLVNWLLLALVILLVLGFRTSSNLASAYGIAVTGTMFITACMLGVLTFAVWKWHPALATLVTGAFLIVDGAYFASNVTKIPMAAGSRCWSRRSPSPCCPPGPPGGASCATGWPRTPCRSTCSLARSWRK
jgi:hypothetical protein